MVVLMFASSAPFSSIQDMRHIPSGNVPVVIKADATGAVRIHALGLLGRFKVSFLSHLKGSQRQVQTSRKQLHQFLRHHYSEDVTDDALKQVGLSASRGHWRALTSRQVRQALSYAHQHNAMIRLEGRLSHLQEARAMAKDLIWETPFTEKGHELSRDYLELRDKCARLRPPINIRTMNPEQWRYARKSLLNDIYIKSRHGVNRMSKKEIMTMAVAVFAQANELGVEGCQKVALARNDARKALQAFFKAQKNGDTSALVSQLARISQTQDVLKQANMAAVHPKAEGYISRAYQGNEIMGCMIAHLEEEARTPDKMMTHFQELGSSLTRDGLVQGIRDVFERQQLEGILSKESAHHLERSATMLEHLHKHVQPYSQEQGVPARASHSDAFPYRDVADQMRLYGGGEKTKHFARVRHARAVLSEARSVLKHSLNAPSPIAISESGRGHEKSEQSLDFLRLALQSAMKTDTALTELRAVKREQNQLKQKFAQKVDTFDDEQKFLQLDNKMRHLAADFLNSHSDYMQLYREVQQFSRDVRAYVPSPLSAEEEYYQDKLDALVASYHPENWAFS
ncbi:MAG: hypothetical protein GDA50_06750 [Alphaproteobacteria bacterium GM202ARS2]|nr:hypothetical protein [Alphaproteobacteria bacterium GM202ARS2]